MTRTIDAIQEDLWKARKEYARAGPTHAATEKCERLYAELIEAQRKAAL